MCPDALAQVPGRRLDPSWALIHYRMGDITLQRTDRQATDEV